MTVPEHLLKAFSQSVNDDVGDYGEARAALDEFVTDLESFTQVVYCFEDMGSKLFVVFIAEYPELYQEYSVAEGLVDDE